MEVALRTVAGGGGGAEPTGGGAAAPTAATAGEPVGGVAEGGPFFLHRAVAAVGDAGGGDQAEEDAELERRVDRDAAEAAEARAGR